MGDTDPSIKQLQEQCGAGCGQRFRRAAYGDHSAILDSSVLQPLAA